MKSINLIGFLICISSYIFWNEINIYFISLSNIYNPDNGQYIVLYIGLLISFYGISEPITKLFSILFSFNLFDEITGDNGLVNLNDYFDILLIFVLAIYNYKNIKNEHI